MAIQNVKADFLLFNNYLTKQTSSYLQENTGESAFSFH